jgi:hypothetical protein
VNFNDPNGLAARAAATWLDTQTTSYVNNLGNSAVNTFGDPSTWAGNGAAAGGIAGGIVGGLSGGVGGGFGGTLVAPGFGTIGGAYTGSLAGAIQGAGIGATAGGLIGATAADLYYQAQANNGNAPAHGGDNHNDAINKEVNGLQQDSSVSGIRKNQQQVDVNGNKVGTNRPDIQYDQNGCHYCVEYDNSQANSVKHGQVIQGNDPNTQVILNLLNK